MKIEWHDIKSWGVEGKGWEKPSGYFERLPLRARKVVPEAVWNLSRSSTGMAVLFETDATEIHAGWKLKESQLSEAEFASCGFSGLDLYARKGREWIWCGTGRIIQTKSPKQCLIENLPRKKRKFILYLPLRNRLSSVKIGVPKGAYFKPVAPRRTKPLCFYGTSIVHGAYASRPGMVYSAILGRRFDKPVINLGFSGNARMEEALARLLTEIDPLAYIIDPLPNMDSVLVRERAELFLRILGEARPDTPIVVVEDGCPYANSWIRPEQMKGLKEKWRELNRAVQRVRKNGVKNIHYVPHDKIFGKLWTEMAPDGIHPTDLGYVALADSVGSVLAKAVG